MKAKTKSKSPYVCAYACKYVYVQGAPRVSSSGKSAASSLTVRTYALTSVRTTYAVVVVSAPPCVPSKCQPATYVRTHVRTYAYVYVCVYTFVNMMCVDTYVRYPRNARLRMCSMCPTYVRTIWVCPPPIRPSVHQSTDLFSYPYARA